MAGNKLKSEKKEPKKKKEQLPDPSTLKPDKEPEVKVKELVKDERTHKVMGAFFLLLSLYCFIAFTSYLFTWEEDFDKVHRYSSQVLFMLEIEVDNLLGRLGAFTSHWFFFKGFGIASFLFCYFFFIIGINFIVGRRVFRIWRNVKYIIFGLLFISMTFAFLTGASAFPWGGAMGDALNRWTGGFLGKTGEGLLLLVTGLSWVIWRFNVDFKWPEKKPKPVKEPFAGFGEPDEEDDELTAPFDTQPAKSNAMKGDGSPVTVIPPVEEETFEQELQLIEKEEEPAAKAITYIPPVPEPPVSVPEPEPGSEPEIAYTPPPPKKNAKTEDVAFEIKPVYEDPSDEEVEEIVPVREAVPTDPYEPTLDLRDYKYPALDLLENHGSDKIVQDASELEKNKNQIIDTLKNYDISIQ
ncbi:MAG: DNA translocase FtsK 4TM domain-containing protein, partial [Chitinophaga sp.]